MERVVDLVVLERLADEDHVAGVVLDEQDLDDVQALVHGVISSVAMSGTGRVKRKVDPPPFWPASSQIAPAVVLDDLAAHREPDPGPRVDVPGVQALEDDEDPVGVLGVDADAVVGHGELPALAVAARRDAHQRRLVAVELDRVGDQVLEHESEQRALAVGPRADPPAPRRWRRSPRWPARGHSSRARRGRRRRPARGGRSTRPTREKASRSLISACMRLAPSTAKAMYCSPRSSSWPAVAVLEQLAEARHLAQRLLEVVRGDVGELLELGVGAFERDGLLLELLLGGAHRLEIARRSARASTRRRAPRRSMSLGPLGSIARSQLAAGDTAARLPSQPRDGHGDDLPADHRDGQPAPAPAGSPRRPAPA